MTPPFWVGSRRFLEIVKLFFLRLFSPLRGSLLPDSWAFSSFSFFFWWSLFIYVFGGTMGYI